MAVVVKVSASLRELITDYDPMTGLSVKPIKGDTVLKLMNRLGIKPEKVKIVMVNGVITDHTTGLNDGDRVAFFPPVGGG